LQRGISSEEKRLEKNNIASFSALAGEKELQTQREKNKENEGKGNSTLLQKTWLEGTITPQPGGAHGQ